ncbi:hypothetical protein [Neopusillimonas aromaticivorans]|uniref:hypothetical protein n=1 Tax=Neopusillimonas aromaticivorans TaxID=2979868 RepID=UPI0025973E95|nr:hypothetical protein [Neopusillimonas aromaticivorans]WJJ93264.1 hypothetical protein N7E01_14815 [Neopusillimonas aromaticivorans]
MNFRHLIVAAATAGAALAAPWPERKTLTPMHNISKTCCAANRNSRWLIFRPAKEAAAALQAARSNTLTNGAGTDYQANERARCMALPETQRADCLLLISGQNTQVRGSVSQGGVLRETTIIIPAPEPVAPATPLLPEAAVPSPVRP